MGRRAGRMDYYLLFMVLFIAVFGLLMIYSSSSYGAMMDNKDGAYYFWKQLGALGVGLAVLVVCQAMPYTLWPYMAIPAWAAAAFSILMIIPFGNEKYGAKRWIRLPFINLNFQPAELAKLAAILCGAVMAIYLGKRLAGLRGTVLYFLPPGILALMLLVITRNLSSAIIVMGISAVIYFVAIRDYWRFVLFSALGAVGGFALVRYLLSQAEKMVLSGEEDKMNFRGARVLAWLDPEKYVSGSGFQILQGLYAIGSGGIQGKGLGEGMQKLGVIPEVQNDMIFAVICEELGVVGGVGVLFLFCLLLWMLLEVGLRSESVLGLLLTCGVLAHFAIQVLLNVAVATNSMPNTGVSLPFISYGGTSVVFLLAEVGIVLGVSKFPLQEEGKEVRN